MGTTDSKKDATNELRYLPARVLAHHWECASRDRASRRHAQSSLPISG